MRHAFPLIAAALIAAAIAQTGLAETFGAHPWWAAKVVYFGAPVGLALAFALGFTRIPPLIRLAGFVALLVAGIALATYGKAQFAASFADDALAGKFWYFGWIATSAALIASIATALQALRRQPPDS